MRLSNHVPSLLCLAAAITLAACQPPEPLMKACPDTATMAEGLVAAPLDIQPVVGDDALTLGTSVTAPNGATYRVSAFRFYVSKPRLLTADGHAVEAVLATHAGEPLPYGVALVDASVPDSKALAILAPPGDYQGLELLIGVPDTCATGELLNHGDASARLSPLDVDSDMYWSWNPGYVHLKVEGRVLVDGQWESMFFHVGEDKRRESIRLEKPIHLATDSSTGMTVAADVNRLFVTAQGTFSPNLGPDRTAHGGTLADEMAENIAHSGFLRAR